MTSFYIIHILPKCHLIQGYKYHRHLGGVNSYKLHLCEKKTTTTNLLKE